MIIRPIVVGVHPGRHETEAVELAVTLSCLTEAPLEVVGTYWFDTTPGRTVRKDFERRIERQLSELLDGSEVAARACGAVRSAATGGSPARIMHATAERVRAAMIVVGSDHRGPLGRITLGRTTDKVLDGAPCPVAVAPRGFTDPDRHVEHVGVAFVDTREGRAALRGGAAIARRTGARLVAYTVLDSPSDHALDRARAALHAALETCPDDVTREARVLLGGVGGLIESSRELDLLVAGSRGYGPLRGTVLGADSRMLARHASCPLIVVPRGVEHPLADLFATRTSLKL